MAVGVMVVGDDVDDGAPVYIDETREGSALALLCSIAAYPCWLLDVGSERTNAFLRTSTLNPTVDRGRSYYQVPGGEYALGYLGPNPGGGGATRVGTREPRAYVHILTAPAGWGGVYSACAWT